MAKRKGTGVPDLDGLIDKFVEVSRQISPLAKVKKTLGNAIKSALGDKEAYSSPLGEVTYKYDEDKPIEVVDMLMLKEKYPKVYAAVVTKDTKKGARKLRMPVEDEE